MYKDITLEGKWFLPDQPDETYNGTFTYTEENGCRLKLYDGVPKHLFERGDYPFILGLVKDEDALKQEVTLVDCIHLSTHQTYDVSHISNYASHEAYIGKHFNNPNQLIFDQVHASLVDLNNWLDFEGIKPIYDGNDISINYQNPSEIHFVINDSLKGSISYSYKLPQQYPWMLGVHQIGWINLFANRASKTKDFLKDFFTFYKFIGLAYASGPPVESLFLSNTSDLTEKGTPYRVQLLFSNGYRNHKYKIGRNELDFLFSYKRVKDDFERIITKWFELYNLISPSINILNAFLIKKDFPLDVKIVQITKALESFHREQRNILPSSNDLKKQKKYNDLVSAAPAFKDWLEEMFRYSFEPNLKRRLIALFEEIPEPILQELDLNTRDKRKSLAEKVKDTRNYYTHFSSYLAKLKLDGIELFKVTEKLKVCLVCLLLKELGFNNNQIADMVWGSRLYSFTT